MKRTLGRLVAALTATAGLIAGAFVAIAPAEAAVTHASGGKTTINAVSTVTDSLPPTSAGAPTYGAYGSNSMTVSIPEGVQVDASWDFTIGVTLSAAQVKTLSDAEATIKFTGSASLPSLETLVNSEQADLAANKANVRVTASNASLTATYTAANTGTFTFPAGLNEQIEFRFKLNLSPLGYKPGSYGLTVYLQKTTPSLTYITTNSNSPYAPTATQSAISKRRAAYKAILNGQTVPMVLGYTRSVFSVSTCSDPAQIKAGQSLAAFASQRGSDQTLSATSGKWLARPNTERAAINAVFKPTAADITKQIRATADIVVDNSAAAAGIANPEVDLTIWNTTTKKNASAECLPDPVKPRLSLDNTTKKVSIEIPSTVLNSLGSTFPITLAHVDNPNTVLAKAEITDAALKSPAKGYYAKAELKLVKPTASVTSTVASDQWTATESEDYVARYSINDPVEGLIAPVSPWSNYAAAKAKPTGRSLDFSHSLNAGGGTVTITGRNFTATGDYKIAGVYFDGWTTDTPATSFKVVNDTTMTVKVPAHTDEVQTGVASIAHPVMSMIMLKMTKSTAMDSSGGVFYYVGTTKATHTVDMTVDKSSFTGLSTDGPMYTTASEASNLSSYYTKDPVITAGPASVCSFDYNQVKFNGGAGDCTIKATAAASLVFDKAEKTEVLTVRKPDTIIDRGYGNSSVTGYLGDEGFIPEIESTSGRPVTLTVKPSSASVCETPTVDSATQKVGTVYALPGVTYGYCELTVTSAATDSTWKQMTADSSIYLSDAAYGTQSFLLAVPSQTDATKFLSYRADRFYWNGTTGSFKVTSRSRFVGSVTATLGFTDTTGKAQTCKLTFGITKRVTGATIDAIQNAHSAAFCTGTVLTKFKAAYAKQKTDYGYLGVTLDITRDYLEPDTLSVFKKNVASPRVYLMLQ